MIEDLAGLIEVGAEQAVGIARGMQAAQDLPDSAPVVPLGEKATLAWNPDDEHALAA